MMGSVVVIPWILDTNHGLLSVILLVVLTSRKVASASDSELGGNAPSHFSIVPSPTDLRQPFSRVPWTTVRLRVEVRVSSSVSFATTKELTEVCEQDPLTVKTAQK